MMGQRSLETTNVVQQRPTSRLDGEKTGVSLLFSGVFIILGGVTITVMSWVRRGASSNFHWLQLLGPILISVGGTILLTSVCKLRIFSRQHEEEEEVFVIPVGEQSPTGQPVVIQGVNQAVLLHSSTAMLCIPPAYNYTQQENEFQYGRSLSGVCACLPSYDALYCVDNAAFVTREDRMAHRTGTNPMTNPQKPGSKRGRHEESDSTCSLPPAYEDIYPCSHRNSST